MRRRIAWLLLAVAAVGTAACDDFGDGGGSGTETVSTGGPTPPTGGTPAAAPSQPPVQPGEALASRDVQADGADLTIDITGLQRQGEAATLSFRITNTGSVDPWYLGFALGSANLDYTVSGVTLVDPVNAQRYLVARGGGEDGDCACTQNTNLSLSEGDSAEFFATYAAPPPEVATINVEFPRFGVFTDVPIS
jgi:hypothetical protein